MLFCPLTLAFLLSGASLYRLHHIMEQISGSVYHHTPFGTIASACSIAYAPDLFLAG